MDERITLHQKIWKYRDERFAEYEDDIAVEFPLTIVVDGEEFATIVCTPADLEELVVGFLASEGLIRLADEVERLDLDAERGFAYVELANKQTIHKDYYAKRFIGSCCGKSRQFYFHNDMRTAKTITSKLTITAEQCLALMQELEEQSLAFRATGGLHNAALCETDRLLLARSDIGRHNALDKLYGYCLRGRIPMKGKVIAFSGRVSSEVLLKVSKLGVGIVLSRSAPTSLAIELAQDLGVTVVGFIRAGSLNVYTHPQRIE